MNSLYLVVTAAAWVFATTGLLVTTLDYYKEKRFFVFYIFTPWINNISHIRCRSAVLCVLTCARRTWKTSTTSVVESVRPLPKWWAKYSRYVQPIRYRCASIIGCCFTHSNHDIKQATLCLVVISRIGLKVYLSMGMPTIMELGWGDGEERERGNNKFGVFSACQCKRPLG